MACSEDELDELIRASFEASRRTYGSPRVYQDLIKNGVHTSEAAVVRRMTVLKLSPVKPKRWVNTTQSKHDNPVAGKLTRSQLRGGSARPSFT